MKATGIVRRIDDLGRVVIPKEIRRTLRLREGTPLEIFTDREGEIILKKYSPMVELAAFATQYAESMAQSTGMMVCITDRDQIIAVSGGPKKDLLQKNISKQAVSDLIRRATTQMRGYEKSLGMIERFRRIQKSCERLLEEADRLQDCAEAEKLRRIAQEIRTEL